MVSLEEFEKLCWGDLPEQTIKGANYEINIDNNVLKIICDEYPEGYQIYKSGLFEIRNDGSKNSNLILQLSDKTWITDKINLLYDLAEITQKSFPLNLVNWGDTFYNIAYDIYIDKLAEDNSLSPFDSIIKNLETRIEEKSDAALIESLKDGVREELIKRKII
ncbi:MAG: hypothetical protein U5N85_23170 [Arcicella sp.]|nr:hypothetical protein [Arcicella sp.]